MPKAGLLFTLSLVITAAAGAIVQTASRAVAQNRLPLLNQTRTGTRPAPAWRNAS